MLYEKLFNDVAEEAVERTLKNNARVTLERADLVVLVQELLKKGFELGVEAVSDELKNRNGHVIQEKEDANQRLPPR